MFFEMNPFDSCEDVNYIYKNDEKIPFPLHVQSGFELVYVTEGECNINVDDKLLAVRKGEACLIFPYQRHAYFDSKGRCFVCTFTKNMVRHFYVSTKEKRPVNNTFKLPLEYIDLYPDMNIYELKSFLYRICGEFIKQNNEFIANINIGDSSELLDKILNYVNDNYNSMCTLKCIAKDMKYDYSYLSKFFKDNLKISFPSYINSLRIQNACYLLKNTEKNITDIASECGYDSISTFNKAFKRITNKTPKDYKKEL